MNTTSPPRRVPFLLACALAGTFAAAASAQPFEEVFGPRDTVDRGERRVTPVRECPDRGYIAVGTHFNPNQSMVYLVKTDPAGNMQWERTYDVGNDARPDEAFSLAELPHERGYAITGFSERGTIDPLFVLLVDCNGKDPRSAYYAPGATIGAMRIVGHDIIVARSGNPAYGTNAGDLVVAGWIEGSTTGVAPDGYMVRVQQNFPIVWQRRYELGRTERLFGLTEAYDSVGTGTGDIVGVGEMVATTATSQALVMRVDGNSGDMVGGAHCTALYGGPRRESFQSVIELRNDFPNLAIVGNSTSQGMSNDVYLVKTRDNPCASITQSWIGNEGGQPYDEFGYDLKEILEPTDDSTGAVVGDLALTGYAEWGGVRRDAFLLYADINMLAPLTARVYGDHDGNRFDEGRSLAQNYDNGFVIAGFTEFDWEINGDPMDLYLINTTNSSKTGCEKKWDPKYDWPGWLETRVEPRVSKPLKEFEVKTKDFELSTPFFNCH